MSASIPEGVALFDPTKLSDKARALANLPKLTHQEKLIQRVKALSPDDPSIKESVAELNAMLPVSAEEVLVAESAITDRKCGGAAAGNPLKFKESYSRIIDEMIRDPSLTTSGLAYITGYNRQWLHTIISSDAFQARLAEKQKAVCDPIILATIKERLQGVVSRSIEIMETRLESEKVSIDTAMEVVALGAKVLGMGVQKQAVQQNQFVVHIPAPVAAAGDWAAQYGGGVAAEVVTIDGSVVGRGNGATAGTVGGANNGQ
jgi:hypothetical protein